MNSFIILSQAARMSIKRPAIRSFSTIPAKSFFYEEAKAHHQVAPLTDSTVYSPQGETHVSSSTTETTFTPSVNYTFDD